MARVTAKDSVLLKSCLDNNTKNMKHWHLTRCGSTDCQQSGYQYLRLLLCTIINHRLKPPSAFFPQKNFESRTRTRTSHTLEGSSPSICHRLSATALEDHHIIVVIFESRNVVFQVEQRNGSQQRRDTAGSGRSIRVERMDQILNHSVFRGTEVGRQRVEALAAALVGLWRREGERG